MEQLTNKLESLSYSLGFVVSELILVMGILFVIFIGFFTKNKRTAVGWITLLLFSACCIHSTLTWAALLRWPDVMPTQLFEGLLKSHDLTSFFKILIDLAGALTVLMSMNNDELKHNRNPSEYFVLIIAAVLGAHLLLMTTNFIAIFLSLELLSISLYVLTGYNQTKKGAEGSLKYFLFGAVASAIMLYGFSILYGLTGTLDFSTPVFTDRLLSNQSSLILVTGLMTLAGFLYKIAASPMHLWAPDAYEAAPLPIVAFLSIVPKLAGLAVLAKFTMAINLFGQGHFDWQIILSVVAILSITVGNFSALWQNDPKRMMAYSSIAQTGFLLIGIVSFSLQGLQFLIFYSTVYLLANFVVFFGLQLFEKNNIQSIPAFSGWGKSQVMMSVRLLIGLISLAGLPPTSGFTAKLFIFSSLWDAYEETGKVILVWLLVFGLLNTVVSLFYYLKIPYYSFLKAGTIQSVKKSPIENYLTLILVVLILFLFIRPDVLMGWLNKINFVL